MDRPCLTRSRMSVAPIARAVTSANAITVPDGLR